MSWRGKRKGDGSGDDSDGGSPQRKASRNDARRGKRPGTTPTIRTTSSFASVRLNPSWRNFRLSLRLYVLYSPQTSKNRRVSVRNWQGRVVVDIREFYVKDGKQFPGKKGISLTMDQWKVLRYHVEEIDQEA